MHEATEKEGTLETFSNDNFDQLPARVTQGAPFCHDPKITENEKDNEKGTCKK